MAIDPNLQSILTPIVDAPYKPPFEESVLQDHSLTRSRFPQFDEVESSVRGQRR
jgi:hypothetical protein